MHPIEEDILMQMKHPQSCSWGKLLHLPLGTLSQEFYNASLVKQYCETSENTSVDQLKFRLALDLLQNPFKAQNYKFQKSN